VNGRTFDEGPAMAFLGVADRTDEMTERARPCIDLDMMYMDRGEANKKSESIAIDVKRVPEYLVFLSYPILFALIHYSVLILRPWYCLSRLLRSSTGREYARQNASRIRYPKAQSNSHRNSPNISRVSERLHRTFHPPQLDQQPNSLLTRYFPISSPL
jgi:hypothetical protein